LLNGNELFGHGGRILVDEPLRYDVPTGGTPPLKADLLCLISFSGCPLVVRQQKVTEQRAPLLHAARELAFTTHEPRPLRVTLDDRLEQLSARGALDTAVGPGAYLRDVRAGGGDSL
jgi:hypothetical protein